MFLPLFRMQNIVQTMHQTMRIAHPYLQIELAKHCQHCG